MSSGVCSPGRRPAGAPRGDEGREPSLLPRNLETSRPSPANALGAGPGKNYSAARRGGAPTSKPAVCSCVSTRSDHARGIRTRTPAEASARDADPRRSRAHPPGPAAPDRGRARRAAALNRLLLSARPLEPERLKPAQIIPGLAFDQLVDLTIAERAVGDPRLFIQLFEPRDRSALLTLGHRSHAKQNACFPGEGQFTGCGKLSASYPQASITHSRKKQSSLLTACFGFLRAAARILHSGLVESTEEAMLVQTEAHVAFVLEARDVIDERVLPQRRDFLVRHV